MTSGDKRPPYNLEAERSALGSMLLDNECIDEIRVELAPRDFFRSTYQEYCEAIYHLHDAGVPVDGVTLADHLIRLGRYHELGGDETLTEIIDAVPHAANARYYAGIVREKAVSRRLLDAATGILCDCYAAEKTASDLLCDAEQAVFAIGEEQAGDVEHVDTLVGEEMARFGLRSEGELQGLPSGFADLDAMTCGFRPGELTICAARPSQGKTALAMDAACSIAASGPRPLFVSLEMGRQALMARLVSSRAGVDSYRYQRPWTLQAEEKRRVNEAAAWLEGLPLTFDFSPFRSVAQIAANTRRVKRQHGLGLVVIDYLSLIDGQQGRGENRQEVVARISRGLKAMARSVDVPVLCLCQLNRESEKRADKRPILSDLRESGQIEADADVVLLLHRPEYYDPNDRPGVAELIVAKNRNGATGDVRLAFDKHCTRFRPFEAGVPCDGGEPA